MLLDHATYAELDGLAACDPVDGIELKGLGAQRAYALEMTLTRQKIF